MRQIAVPLMLAFAGAQPVLGSSLVATALMLGVHADDHAHSVTLRSDGDHVDVVLSHGEQHSHDHGEAPQDHDLPTSVSEDDHVVHITAGSDANAAARRATPGSSFALTVAGAQPVAIARLSIPTGSSHPRALGVDHLRTVVLRL